MTTKTVEKQISAENTFTDVFRPPKNVNIQNYGRFTLSISGDFVATVTLQRSFDEGATWLDVSNYTQPTEKNIEDFTCNVYYRAGVKTGDFTSGNVSVIIAK